MIVPSALPPPRTGPDSAGIRGHSLNGGGPVRVPLRAVPDAPGCHRGPEWRHRQPVPARPVPEGMKTMGTLSDLFRRNGLTRPVEERVLGGVCAGLGRRLGLSPWRARLVFVLVLLVIPGSQLLVYPILWVLMPRDESGRPAVHPTGTWPAP